MGARGAVLMTREPWNKPGIRLNALDAGAYGIICAMVISKRGAIIINTARGGIVDEVALSEALRQGQIASAGIDVFDAEPPAADHPLLGFDQVILTPHTAGLTREAAERVAVASVQNVLDQFAERLNPALIMNKDF